MSEKEEGNFEKAVGLDPDFISKLSQSPLCVRDQKFNFGRNYIFRAPPKYGDFCIKYGHDIRVKIPSFTDKSV